MSDAGQPRRMRQVRPLLAFMIAATVLLPAPATPEPTMSARFWAEVMVLADRCGFRRVARAAARASRAAGKREALALELRRLDYEARRARP